MVLQDVLHHVFLQTVFRSVLGEFVSWQGKGCINKEDI